MTVKQLIEKLKTFDPKLEVDTEGCDCIGDAYNCIKWDDKILIIRSDGSWYKEHPYKKPKKLPF